MLRVTIETLAKLGKASVVRRLRHSLGLHDRLFRPALTYQYFELVYLDDGDRSSRHSNHYSPPPIGNPVFSFGLTHHFNFFAYH